jgi:L-fuconolactonase
MSLVIDAHQHYWQLSKPFDYEWLKSPQHEPICRDFLPSDLRPHLEANGVNKTVFVQTQHNVDEHRWVLELAEENDFIAGVVGWIDLASEECEDQLLEAKSNPKFVGVRHVTQDEQDDNFIIQDNVLRGLRILEKHGVPFDLLFYVKHLRHTTQLATELPNLPMVIDHISKPRIAAGSLSDWRANFEAAARCPNVCCKLSGMITEADWTNWKPADLKPYIDIALEAFGPDRLMFGSDWPVCELAGSYEQVFNALNECLAPLSDTEKARIFGGTAIDFYSLNV